MIPTNGLIALAAILTPILSIIGTIITVRRMRRADKAAQETAIATVKVSEQNAHTQEVEMIISGFTGSLTAVNAELKRTQDAYGALSEKYGVLGEKYDKLERQYDQLLTEVRIDRRERQEMVDHIQVLEEQVPNPPGPPTRPVWKERGED